jgi:hypothetical protein
MALPKLQNPTYETELPSSGEKIKYRPFLIKEQKILMMAQESEDQKEIMDAMAQLINACTFSKIDANTAPLFDIEYLFLKIRGKSVGEKVKVKVTCPDDKKTKVPVTIDLKDIAIQVDASHTNELKISDNIKMIMKYPVLGDVSAAGDASETNQIFNIMNQCVHEVHDGDTIYHRVDMSDSDLTEFVDSFTGNQFEMVTQFFETMPKLRHAVNVTNPKTKVKSEVLIEGLEAFLA